MIILLSDYFSFLFEFSVLKIYNNMMKSEHSGY